MRVSIALAVLATATTAIAGPVKHGRFHNGRRHVHNHPYVNANTTAPAPVNLIGTGLDSYAPTPAPADPPATAPAAPVTYVNPSSPSAPIVPNQSANAAAGASTPGCNVNKHAVTISKKKTSTQTRFVTSTTTFTVGTGAAAYVTTSTKVEIVEVLITYVTVWVEDKASPAPTGAPGSGNDASDSTAASAVPAYGQNVKPAMPSGSDGNGNEDGDEEGDDSDGQDEGKDSSDGGYGTSRTPDTSSYPGQAYNPSAPVFHNTTMPGNSTNPLNLYQPGIHAPKTTRKPTKKTTKKTKKAQKTTTVKKPVITTKKPGTTVKPATTTKLPVRTTVSTTTSRRTSTLTTQTLPPASTTTSQRTSTLTTQTLPPASTNSAIQTTATSAAPNVPSPIAPGSASPCNKYYQAVSGDYCSKITDANGISLANFYAWNPSVNTNGQCDTLYAGVYYCVSADSKATTTVSTTTTTVNNAPAASTQAGIVANCNKYYTAQTGDGCYAIATANDITLDNFYAWNPAVKTDCSGLWLGYAYCVGISGNPSSAPTTTASRITTTTSYADSDPTGSSDPITGYHQYSGNGTPQQGWPLMSQWATYQDIWDANQKNMAGACANNGWGINNSPTETSQLHDARFILAIVLQESWGCVRVKTTSWSVSNPGLMQSHAGDGTCHKEVAAEKATSEACPQKMIQQMVADGTNGTYYKGSTIGGDGLVQTIQQAVDQGGFGGSVARYYAGARIYNGGLSGWNKQDLGKGCCTLCYASDVANRLTGWAGDTSPCKL